MILTADLLRLLEAMVSSEDGFLFLSASILTTSCGFQLYGVQLSWLFLGCLRSKRKKRPYFLVTLLCLAVLQRGGSPFGYSLLPATGQGGQGSSRRKCLGFVCHPYPPLFPRGITGYMQGENKFALKGRELSQSRGNHALALVCPVVLQTWQVLKPVLGDSVAPSLQKHITSQTQNLTGFSSWCTF